MAGDQLGGSRAAEQLSEGCPHGLPVIRVDRRQR